MTDTARQRISGIGIGLVLGVALTVLTVSSATGVNGLDELIPTTTSTTTNPVTTTTTTTTTSTTTTTATAEIERPLTVLTWCCNPDGYVIPLGVTVVVVPNEPEQWTGALAQALIELGAEATCPGECLEYIDRDGAVTWFGFNP